MWVFYYQWEDGRTYVVCVNGVHPSRKSPLWRNCNTGVFMVPGTHELTDVDDDY